MYIKVVGIDETCLFYIYIRNCSPFLSVRTTFTKSVFIEGIFRENIPVTAYNKGRTDCIYSYVAK